MIDTGESGCGLRTGKDRTMEIDELNRIRRLMGYTCADIAAHSGISIRTVRKALEKQTRNPRNTTREALARALREMILEDRRTGNVIHETVSAYRCGSERADPESGALTAVSIADICRKLHRNTGLYVTIAAETRYLYV